VNLEEGQLRIKRVKTKVEFKVPIYPAIRDLLAQRVEGRASIDRVFTASPTAKGTNSSRRTPPC
jgi:hypothetical protein